MYGYQDTLFEVLGKKVAKWSEAEKHGSIVIDEMTIIPGVGFERSTLQHVGMTNLGKYTSHSTKEEIADHALVVMFQPFQGKWHQSLGCFLSKGNVKGDTLAKLILEGITLSEDAGLRVDAVICDGARWNKNMWEEFGITETSPSCVFGNATAKGIQWYREKKQVSQLQNSQATQAFIERIDRLAHAMNSGGPKGALWDGSEEEKQFFGNIRRMAAPNPHPDAKLFAQLYRLLSVYSLVSPPKGSNVSGVSNVEALVNAKDTAGEEISERQEEFNRILDEILEYEQFPLPVQEEHNYDKSTTEKYLINFMAGFTCHRQKKIAKNCQECLKTLTKDREDTTNVDSWTLMKEIHGGYSIPSDALVSLIKAVEFAVCDTMSTSDVHQDMIFTSLKFLKIDVSCFVGCLDHTHDVTKALVKYYLFTRMFFAADMKNAEMARKKERNEQFAKQSKL
ncbi:T-box protein VegT [Frankliniella fusca]|uniref:T-box protein VegT n=1 Tax=Frankliniella fusca TaxID=407009 RepID=A0AAE1LWU4_9NEOP|nr:T-box protein VegT [Frankliniella fusca]